MSNNDFHDKLAVRQVIEDWVLWRDSGDWDRLAQLWRPDGFIMTTWCEASAEEFIARGRGAWAAGAKVLHTLDGSHIEVDGSRAIAWTKMQIVHRARVHDVQVDVVCHGRFCDAFEKADGHWGLLSRQLIYEMDRILPLEPGVTVPLDEELLSSFPEGYRHLAYVQTKLGLTVNQNLPGTRDPVTQSLLDRMRRWLVEGDRDLVRSAASTSATA